jgi:hypothetical protein
MRHKQFLVQTRKRAKLNRELLTPYAKPNWPICLTCGREVDAVEMKDVTATSVEIWARHHGAEDFHKVVFPFRIEGDPLADDRANWAIQSAMRDASFFDPNEVKK